MKVLLLEDVYKLGRAGEVKEVAPGYGRNYLVPQGLATLATPGALKQAERIKKDADAKRIIVNKEMGAIAEQLEDVTLTFPARASETGRLYGSVNTRMIAEAVSEEAGVEITHRQVESQPLRMIGEHTVAIRLTVDLIPELRAIVYREGETPALALEEEAEREAEEGVEFEIPEDVESGEAVSQAEAGEEPEAQPALEGDAEVQPEAEPAPEGQAEEQPEVEAAPESQTEEQPEVEAALESDTEEPSEEPEE